MQVRTREGGVSRGIFQTSILVFRGPRNPQLKQLEVRRVTGKCRDMEAEEACESGESRASSFLMTPRSAATGPQLESHSSRGGTREPSVKPGDNAASRASVTSKTPSQDSERVQTFPGKGKP